MENQNELLKPLNKFMVNTENQSRTSYAGVNNSTSQTGYAVFRSGIRVSELVHDSVNEAQDEVDHWNLILSRWPDGTKIDVKQVHKS